MPSLATWVRFCPPSLPFPMWFPKPFMLSWEQTSPALGRGPSGSYPHGEVLHKARAPSHCISLWKWKKYCCPPPPVSKREFKEEEMSEKTLGQSLLPQKSPWPEVRAQAEEKTPPKAITVTLASELSPPSWATMWPLHLSDQ